jgi:hypothetical protein
VKIYPKAILENCLTVFTAPMTLGHEKPERSEDTESVFRWPTRLSGSTAAKSVPSEPEQTVYDFALNFRFDSQEGRETMDKTDC